MAPGERGFVPNAEEEDQSMTRVARTGLMLGVLACGGLLPGVARGQGFGGVGVAKQCVGPVLVDPQGKGIARVGDTITCTIEVTNLDEEGHALRFDSVIDT